MSKLATKEAKQKAVHSGTDERLQSSRVAVLPMQHLLAMYSRLQEARRRTVTLASAAHELKTPLAVMAGYTDLLLSSKVGPLTDQQRQILEEMQSSGERLQRFIGDFLTFGALETDNLQMRFEVADINACLSEVCGFWLPRFHEKKVALYFLPGSGMPPFPFDYPKLQHVISNLIHNALKFTPVKGTVWVAVEPYHWDRRSRQESPSQERRRAEAPRLNAVRISVADTGPGIAREFQQDIFNDFLRLPEEPGQAQDGMGLGLAIAKRLIQAHQGAIWIESELGAGSKFSVVVPVLPK